MFAEPEPEPAYAGIPFDAEHLASPFDAEEEAPLVAAGSASSTDVQAPFDFEREPAARAA